MAVASLKRSTLKLLMKYNSMLAGNVGALPDYELIATTVLTSGAASVTFSGLGTSAAGYKHLQIRFTAITAADKLIQFRANSDTGANYSYHGLEGNGSSAASFSSTSQTLAWLGYSPAGSTYPTAGVVDVLDFASTSKNKTIKSLFASNQSGGNRIQLISSAWYSTSAMTSIELFQNNSAQFAAGSRFSLYGLRA